MVAEYDASGARQNSYVLAGGGVVARQASGALYWKHLNPVTGDEVETDSARAVAGKVTVDPAGVALGDTNPFEPPAGGNEEGPTQAEMNSRYAQLLPASMGGGGRCRLEGFDVGCGSIASLAASGLVMQVPTGMRGGVFLRFKNLANGERTTRWAPLTQVGGQLLYLPEGAQLQPDNTFSIDLSEIAVPDSYAVGWFALSKLPGVDFLGLGSGVAPQNPDFRRGGPAFSDAQNTILAEAFKIVNSEGCKKFINETLAKHRVGEDVNSLDKLLNRATFGYFDLNAQYRPADLGLNFRDAMELMHAFHTKGASAVTTGDRLHVFLSDKVFERSSSSIPIASWNRKADTPGYIVHELFHVAGIDKSIVDSQQLTNEIFKHCHLTGADNIILRH